MEDLPLVCWRAGSFRGLLTTQPTAGKEPRALLGRWVSGGHCGPSDAGLSDSSSQGKAGDWDPLPGDKHLHGPFYLCLGSPDGGSPILLRTENTDNAPNRSSEGKIMATVCSCKASHCMGTLGAHKVGSR